MPRSRRWTDDGGSASLEFITAGLVLLVPIVYLVLALSAVQAATLAVDGAARQATRVYVQSGVGRGGARSRPPARSRSPSPTTGWMPRPPPSQISCRPRAAACLTRRGFVTVTIGTDRPAAARAAVPRHRAAGRAAGVGDRDRAGLAVLGLAVKRRVADDEGSILPLICFYGALALLVTLIVAVGDVAVPRAQAALHPRRRRRARRRGVVRPHRRRRDPARSARRAQAGAGARRRARVPRRQPDRPVRVAARSTRRRPSTAAARR